MLCVLWIIPLIPLVYVVPRMLIIYALVHRSENPPREWLRTAAKGRRGGRGGGHGHGHGHGHGGDDDVPRHKKQERKLQHRRMADRALQDELSLVLHKSQQHRLPPDSPGPHSPYLGDHLRNPLLSGGPAPGGASPTAKGSIGPTGGVRAEILAARNRVRARQQTVSHLSSTRGSVPSRRGSDPSSPAASGFSAAPPSPGVVRKRVHFGSIHSDRRAGGALVIALKLHSELRNTFGMGPPCK